MASVIIGDYEYTLNSTSGTASAKVTDKSKSSYGALQSSVSYGGKTWPVTSLLDCFRDCTSLVTAPSIPSSIKYMHAAFRGCVSLATAPSIPSSVTSVYACFRGCTSLTAAPVMPSSIEDMGFTFLGCTSLVTAPSIPSSLKYLNGCFKGCTALTGSITTMGAAPTNYDEAFLDTTLPIYLNVSNQANLAGWKQVADQSPNVKVVCPAANPVPTCSASVIRVASRGSSVEAEEGTWAMVSVDTAVSDDYVISNSAHAPTVKLDGGSTTVYDASGTANYRCWVSLGDLDKHVISVTPQDDHKSGTAVTVTLAASFATMDFLAGGNGAALGKHATKQGVLDIGWDVEADGDITADGAVSGASVNATGDVTADDCKSANYSLEAVGDSISQLSTVPATRNTTNTTSGWIQYERVRRQVTVNLVLNCKAVSAGAVLATGLPPSFAAGNGVIVASGNKAICVYVDGNGRLVTATAISAAQYQGAISYVCP